MFRNIEKIYKISELKKSFNVEYYQTINEIKTYSDAEHSLNAISNLKKQNKIEQEYDAKFREILNGKSFFGIGFKPKNIQVYFSNSGIKTENIKDSQAKYFFNIATYLQNKGFFIHMESKSMLDFKLLIVTDDIGEERKEIEQLLKEGGFDEVMIDRIYHLKYLC